MAGALTISRSLLDIFNTIETEGDINSKVKHVLENELVRRLNRYELTVRNLEKKYELSFKEFKKKGIVGKKVILMMLRMTYGNGSHRWTA